MGGGLAIGASRLIGDRYELEAPIGKGGIGEVWRARHVALNSRVAIKFLQLASAEKESAKRRFTTEAQITAQLKTPNAVQVFDFGVTEDGQPYLVMELLEGETLGRRLERVGRLGILETAVILGQAARALQRAHQLGIVHRDFKPDNVVICVDDQGRDQVKVLDFGIAKLVGALEEGAAIDDDDTIPGDGSMPSFTGTGMMLGTPLYMAPEQVRDAADVDLRADLWAFGVVAFQCLTGRAPFTGATLPELFERIQGGLHPRADFLEPTIPPGFDTWFDIACAPDPSKRFPLAAVAYKHLTVALDVMRDNSGSFPGVLDPHTSSGERRILVVGRSEPPDARAATVDAVRSAGEVRTRTHNDEFASLQRIPLRTLDPGSPADSAAPIARERATSKPAVGILTRMPWRGLLVGLVGVGVVAAGGVVWRLGTAGARSSSPPAGSIVTAVAPVTALIASATATATAQPLPLQPMFTASTPSSPEPTTAARHDLRPPVRGARSPVAVPTVSALPVASPPAAPPPTKPVVVDPGSYR